MSWRARIIGLVAVLLAVTLAAVLASRWLLAPGRLASRIEAVVLEATGLPLELRGSPRLALLPRLALDLGPGRLGDGAVPLLEWSDLRIDAHTTSILGDAPEFGRLVVEGLRLQLRRDAAGQGNWEPALRALQATMREQAGSGSARIAGLELTNARVEYLDARDPAGRLVLGDLALTGSAWSAGQPLGLDARFFVERGGARVAVLSDARLRLEDAGSAGWRIADLLLRGRWRSGQRELPFALASPRLDLDTTRGMLRAGSAGLELGPARVTLEALQAAWPESADLRAEGSFVLAEFAPRELMGALGLAGPRTRDPTALAHAWARGRVAWEGGVLRVGPVTFALDDSRLDGSLRWGDVLDFTLQGDSIDLDRYREPAEVPTEPFVFPGEAFAAWQARGTLSLQRARIEGVEMEGVTLRAVLDGEPPVAGAEAAR